MANFLESMLGRVSARAGAVSHAADERIMQTAKTGRRGFLKLAGGSAVAAGLTAVGMALPNIAEAAAPTYVPDYMAQRYTEGKGFKKLEESDILKMGYKLVDGPIAGDATKLMPGKETDSFVYQNAKGDQIVLNRFRCNGSIYNMITTVDKVGTGFADSKNDGFFEQVNNNGGNINISYSAYGITALPDLVLKVAPYKEKTTTPEEFGGRQIRQVYTKDEKFRLIQYQWMNGNTFRYHLFDRKSGDNWVCTDKTGDGDFEQKSFASSKGHVVDYKAHGV